jgi:hypothetical protein
LALQNSKIGPCVLPSCHSDNALKRGMLYDTSI